MFKLTVKLIQWNLTRNRLQLLIMVLAVIGSLSSYVLLGTALNAISAEIVQSQRDDWPFDLTIKAPTEDEKNKIRQIEGIYHSEELNMEEVYFYSNTVTALGIPEEETVLILELESGSLPQNDDQVTIPGEVSRAYNLSIGQKILLRTSTTISAGKEFEIAGIFSTKKGVTKTFVVTNAAIHQLNLQHSGSSLVIQLDGKADLEKTYYKVLDINPKLVVTMDSAGYENAQVTGTISDSLIKSLRFLILAISATSLAVLFYLSQRSGAYQTGVLRAIGVKRFWLLLPPLIQISVVFLISCGIAYILLPILSRILGLNEAGGGNLSSVGWDLLVFFAIGLLSTIAVNLQFLHRSIPTLFKDTW